MPESETQKLKGPQEFTPGMQHNLMSLLMYLVPYMYIYFFSIT